MHISWMVCPRSSAGQCLLMLMFEMFMKKQLTIIIDYLHKVHRSIQKTDLDKICTIRLYMSYTAKAAVS